MNILECFDYHFHSLTFPSGKAVVRIHFSEPAWQALERFFNDDATVIKEELDGILSTHDLQQEHSYAGNRCVISLSTSIVTIEDQWDNTVEGYFPPVTLPLSWFVLLYKDWEKNIVI